MDSIKNKLSKNSTNLNGLDLMKFIMAIFVVGIHTDPLVGCTNGSILKIFDILTRCAVPFFFITSGYLLARKFEEPYYCDKNQKNVIRYLLKIIKMYLLWSLIYFPMALYKYKCENYTVIYSIMVTLRKLIFRGENYNSWMMWYLLSTIYALLIVWITMKLKCKKEVLIVISVFMFIVNRYTNIIAWSTVPYSGILFYIKRIIELTISDGRIFGGFIYLPIGICLRHNERMLKYLRLIFIPAILVLFFAENDLLCAIIEVIKSIALFGVAISLNIKNCKIFKMLRESSLIIYLVHMYVFVFVRNVLITNDEYGISRFLITVIISVGCSFAYIAIKTRKSYFLQLKR